MVEEYFCEECFSFHRYLGQHWINSISCSEPDITERQREIITGVLMGDGNINCPGNTPYFRITNIQKEYLEYLDDVLSPFTNGVREGKTSEELGQREKSGWNIDPANYNDQYCLKSWCLEQMQEFEDWYSSGSKVFPEDINLTPTVLKHWYVCDGWYSIPESSKRGRFIIRADNESDNTEKLDKYFKESLGFSVDYWRMEDQGERCALVFFADKTEEIFDYIGGPLPGFEYKWPEEKIW